jgi:hypothetical protein
MAWTYTQSTTTPRIIGLLLNGEIELAEHVIRTCDKCGGSVSRVWIKAELETDEFATLGDLGAIGGEPGKEIHLCSRQCAELYFA